MVAGPGRPRLPVFRALGGDDPPDHVEIRGGSYRRLTVLKHDSWAATALYVGRWGKAICKFNRRQPILGVPMAGLGRLLAEREARILRRLADLPGVPRWLGPVVQHGAALPHALARSYVEGRPLGRRDRVPPRFFDQLADLLRGMHARGLAYVDLHKRENILVAHDGSPYLIDFQISFNLGDGRSAAPEWLQNVLTLLQEADWYHLAKHRRHHLGAAGSGPAGLPWFIGVHRLIGYPFRELRRRLLVALGIRTGAGRASSEHFPEDAVQQELDILRAA